MLINVSCEKVTSKKANYCSNEGFYQGGTQSSAESSSARNSGRFVHECVEQESDDESQK